MSTLIQTESLGEDNAANRVVPGQEDPQRFAEGTEALASAKSAVPKVAVVDDDENIQIKKIKLSTAIKKCLNGKINDAKTIAALLAYYNQSD